MAEVYCTLVLTDSYLPGAQVLAHSLRDGGTTRKLAVIVTPGEVSEGTVLELSRLYDYVLPVERIYNHQQAHLNLMGRLDLSSAFTKIHLWRLTQFSRIIYVDADIVALRAPDELFETAADFAACPDIGWPDCFNSGLMVIKPDLGTYHGLLNLAQRGISFDGADQGLLNMHFRDWHRLSFVYNVTPSGNYQYTPAYRHFQSNVTMIHFIGPNKPWMMGRDAEQENPGSVYGEQLAHWWSKWDSHYRPLTEQDPSLSWEPATAPEKKNPTEYDPNFRRDHDAEDNSTTGGTTWTPPPKIGSTGSQSQPSSSRSSVNPYSAQNVEHQPYIPPMFLPKEHVPYVPREMPYSAYSQTQIPAHAHVNYRHHDEFKKVETHYPAPEPDSQLSSENQERADNDLPKRPDLAEEDGVLFPDPPPTSEPEQHPFEAPMNTWDPARFSPPPHSDAEASNFPSQVYSNRWDSSSEEKWKPPPPSAPPKNLSYELPKARTLSGGEKPAPVFPWEEREHPTTSRVFDDDEETEEEVVTPTYIDEEEETEEEKVANAFEEDPEVHWHKYDRQNAWDSIPEIDRYVADLQRGSRDGGNPVRRGDVTPNPVFRVADLSVRDDEIPDSSSRIVPPDLPVTPNPVRMRGSWRPSSMNDEERYPSAKGVAEAHQWDPLAKLEELKQAPKLLLQKKSPPSPLPVGIGSPRSPGNILVSSSVPVPQLPFHITAYQQRHNTHRKNASSSGSASSYSFPSPSPTLSSTSPSSVSSNSTIMPSALRPIARRYNHSATQTEKAQNVDVGTQSEDEDYEDYLMEKQHQQAGENDTDETVTT